jgi:hypothetical protein
MGVLPKLYQVWTLIYKNVCIQVLNALSKGVNKYNNNNNNNNNNNFSLDKDYCWAANGSSVSQ